VRKLSTFLAMVLIASLPSMAATKITVKQLDEILAEQHKAGKGDQAVSVKLQDLELTEMLTIDAMNNLTQYDPGPYTVTQIRVLELESAMLPPPPSDIPSTATPDAAAQAAIIAKAVDYDTKQYAVLPKLSAEKQTIRYQDGVDYTVTNSGQGGSFAGGSLEVKPSSFYIRMVGQSTTAVQSEGGVDIAPAKTKAIDPASQNGQVSQGGAGMVLGAVLMDAAKGKITWLRWQFLNGKQVAVFAFAVDKKQSHYTVNYCCFPETNNIGAGHNASGGSIGTPGTSVTYHPYTAKPGYHGELYIDPDTGAIMRLVTQAEMKPTDLVHFENVRTDYGPVDIGGKKLIVPVKVVIQAEVVPNGDSYVKYSTRRTYFDVNYKNYELR